jgi:hypothetical protein
MGEDSSLGRISAATEQAWVAFEGRFVILDCEADLLDVVRAGHSSSGFSGGLHGWQEQSDKDTDDGDHDEQFHEGKSATGAMVARHLRLLNPE